MNMNAQDQSIFGDILRGRDERAQGNSCAPPHAETSIATTEDFGSFGWLHGAHERADFLELKLKSGNIGAIPYGWIEFIEFDPSVGITLDARGKKFRITGRNLNGELRESVRLFEGIVHRRVPWIREADRAAFLEARDGSTVVESISW